MFDAEALSLVACPRCRGGLNHSILEGRGECDILEAVVWCASCREWFPLEDGVLDLLLGDLAYPDDRARFVRRYANRLRELGLSESARAGEGGTELQSKQQSHFDWYTQNEKQTYLEYEQMPFWQAADAMAFEDWARRISPGARLLDVGCGNGRSTFKLGHLGIRILGFDVSKGAIRQAERRARGGTSAARISFMAADASRFPVRTSVIDCVLAYGVLHHLPDPRAACSEAARVLKPGGLYLGSENNRSVFRRVFEWIQKLRPLWYEEAGPEFLISARMMEEAFSATTVSVRTRSTIFVPPHLANFFSRWSASLLRISDRIGRAIPWIRDNGGLLLIEGVKR